MERTIRQKSRLGSWINVRTVIVLVVLLLPFNLFFFPARTEKLYTISGVKNPIIDTWPGYQPEKVFRVSNALKPEGRRLYALTELSLDVVYPILYSLLLGVGLTLTLPKAFPDWRLGKPLTRLPLLLLTFDYLENAGIVTLLLLHPAQPVGLAGVTSWVTLIKWALAVVCVGLLLVSLLVVGVKSLR